MSNSYQNEIPKARINLQLDLHAGSAAKKTELPLKLLMTGDVSDGAEDRPLSESEKINVNENHFNNVLADDGSEENVALNVRDIKDVESEQVTRQIPQMRAMLAMRNLLRDLKSHLLDNITFRKELEAILKIPALGDELHCELSGLATDQA